MAVNNDNTTAAITKSPPRDEFSSLSHQEPRKSLRPKRTESCVQEDKGTASHCLFGFCSLIFGKEDFFSLFRGGKKKLLCGCQGLLVCRLSEFLSRTNGRLMQVCVFSLSGTLDTKTDPELAVCFEMFCCSFFSVGAGGDGAVCYIKGERPTKDVGGIRPETGMHVSNSHRIASHTLSSDFLPFPSERDREASTKRGREGQCAVWSAGWFVGRPRVVILVVFATSLPLLYLFEA
ncbi:hypothetical protein QBC37DRAFT_178001 [Rhypophila decipiens]|uniref:Uncharacterized protein n=1 Tax=Rhypophila decipiens TaxID=261697 RepID=A0AAN6YIM7_9PEZI|nr:hypothetical protein QBC37DRAFT_178001 [Rhypophila decipiens]